MPRRPTLALLVIATVLLLLARNTTTTQAATATQPHLADPDKACIQCHAAIVNTYQKTSMAKGSGLATEQLDAATFTHQTSGVTYKVSEKDGIARLHSTRESEVAPLDDSEQLAYYIGSGIHGRTYLFSRSNGDSKLWYEAPINWYTRRAAYGMAPAYDAATTAPLALPTDANCLHCHTGSVQQTLPTAPNAFSDQPFLQAGIGCSSCHGSSAEHLRTQGKSRMLKLATLSPGKQDSVCLQCHLEGDAMVQRSGHTLSSFTPGQELSDTAVYFVNASSEKTKERAGSQYEALLRSACRRAVGESLTCTTCHDPHSEPSPEQRVAFYRGKCLQCHGDSASFHPAAHHPEQQSCAACHMPSRATSDISHEQNVDHDIEARHQPHGASSKPTLSLSNLGDPAPQARFTRAVDLIPIGNAQPTDRERGLAYAQFAVRGDRASYGEAVKLLQSAEAQGADDSVVHEQLGYLAQIAGDAKIARSQYAAALAKNTHDEAALSNLAVLDAQQGDMTSAIRHLTTISTDDPGQTTALLNLALLQCKGGEGSAARSTLKRALQFNPDSPDARRFLTTGDYGGSHCAVH